MGDRAMSWEEEVADLERRRDLAQQIGGAENIGRHHARGKLIARVRIALLADTDSG